MLTCTIVSPQETLRYEQLAALDVPSSFGRAQILPGHAEAFMALSAGAIVLIYQDGRREEHTVPACECHVEHDEVLVLA